MFQNLLKFVVRIVATGLCLAPLGCSQTVAPISALEVNQVTRTSARVMWQSSRQTSFQVLYGETTGYGLVAKTYILNNGPQYSTALTGLRPGTTYYFCPQTMEGEKSICNGQTNTFRFTTLGGGIREAEVPRTTVDVGQPELNGQVFQVRTDCSDLQEQLNLAAKANPDQNHEVRIPPGIVCHGRYTMPARADSPRSEGWITIRGDVTDDELPPQGVQINPSYAQRMPVLRSDYVSVWFYPNTPDSCQGGDFWWKSTEKSWALFRCASPDGPKWEPIKPTASGTSVPQDCNVGDWFFKSDEPDRHRQAWWCIAPNDYQNVYFDNGGYLPEFATIQAAKNAHHYRIQGVQITHIPLPANYAELFNSKGGRKKGNINGCLAMTPATSHHITFDRVWFRGYGYPSGLWYALCMWDGAYQAIVNSYFSEVNRWVHPDTTEEDSRAINIEQGPGPGRIENNLFENTLGITIFVSDDAGDQITVPADYTIRRNRMLLSDAYNGLSPKSNGHFYYRRHHLELKRGFRFLVEGNVLDGGWTAQNAGAAVVLTPRTGPGTDSRSNIGITDFLFRDNILRNSPEGFLVVGHNDGGPYQTLTTQRVTINNNLVYGLSGERNGWGGNRKGTGQFINMGLGLEDLSIRHNTIFNSTGVCCLPNFLSHAWWEPNGGLDARFNLFSQSFFDARVGIWLGGSFEGKEALDTVWKSGAQPEYTVTENVFLRRGGDPGIYPKGNYFIDNMNAFGFDEQLQLTQSSAFRAGQSKGASDGKDMGVDITKLKKALHTIDDLQLAEGGADRAVLSYKFLADSEGIYCAVDLTDQQNFGQFTRYWDNGQEGSRLAELSGLKPKTVYLVRMQCGAASLFAKFQTDPAPEGGPDTASLAAKPAGTSSGGRRIQILEASLSQMFPESFSVPAANNKKRKK